MKKILNIFFTALVIGAALASAGCSPQPTDKFAGTSYKSSSGSYLEFDEDGGYTFIPYAEGQTYKGTYTVDEEEETFTLTTTSVFFPAVAISDEKTIGNQWFTRETFKTFLTGDYLDFLDYLSEEDPDEKTYQQEKAAIVSAMDDDEALSKIVDTMFTTKTYLYFYVDGDLEIATESSEYCYYGEYDSLSDDVCVDSVFINNGKLSVEYYNYSDWGTVSTNDDGEEIFTANQYALKSYDKENNTAVFGMKTAGSTEFTGEYTASYEQLGYDEYVSLILTFDDSETNGSIAGKVAFFLDEDESTFESLDEDNVLGMVLEEGNIVRSDEYEYALNRGLSTLNKDVYSPYTEDITDSDDTRISVSFSDDKLSCTVVLKSPFISDGESVSVELTGCHTYDIICFDE